MRQPRTVSELLAFLGRRQTNNPAKNIPVVLPSPVPAPILIPQPGQSTRSIPGFKTIPFPTTANATPTPAGGAGAGEANPPARATNIPPPRASAPPAASAPLVTPPVASSPPVASAPPVTSASNVEVGNVIPAPSSLPASSASGSMVSDMNPVPTAPAAAEGGPPNAASPEARGQQIGVVVGIIVGVGLLVGLVAMFCVRRRNRKRAKEPSSRSSTPDFISRPLARNGSDPWQGPIMARSAAGNTSAGDSTRAAQATASDAWPLGAADNPNRNSMEDARWDEKQQQYVAYRPAPGAPQQGPSQPPQAALPISRWASNNESYGPSDGVTAAQPGLSPPSQQQQQQQQQRGLPPSQEPERDSLSKWSAIAKVNQHYSQVEKQMLSPSYYRSGAPGGPSPVEPPSPLYFRPVGGNPRPDSATFGTGGRVNP